MEARAFAAFVDQHRAALLKYAMVLTGDFGVAEDLVADSLGHAFERWDRVGAVDNPHAYVRRMVTNQFLMSKRRRALWLRRRAQLARPDHSPDPTGDVDGREAMIARLAILPPKQRSVIVMRFYLNLTDAEIADELGCKPATVRSHAARALAALRLTISGETETETKIGTATDRDLEAGR